MNHKTYLINLWAGPGAGKSTTAAGVFERLKLRGESCELITEYVKAWAWRGEKIGEFDDLYITAKQLRRESALYGKVDYIVTDSPIGLGAVYEQMYKPSSLFMAGVCEALRARQAAAGVRIVDCLLTREKAYVQAGRYEDENSARRVDEICASMLSRWHPVRNADDVVHEVLALRAEEVTT